MYDLSRRGIAYNLHKSPYWTNINYGKYELTYVFSSLIVKEKFVKKIEENRKKINLSLSNRFGFEIEACLLADIYLYKHTEHRGFLILGNEVEYTWQNIIILIGENLIQKS